MYHFRYLKVTFGGPRVKARLLSELDNTSDSEDGDDDDTSTSKSSAKDENKSAPSPNIRKRANKVVAKSASFYHPPDEPTLTSRLLKSIRGMEVPPHPYTSPCRPNANDVDVAHPWIMTVHPPREPGNNAPLVKLTQQDGEGKTDANAFVEGSEYLTIENNNPAVECLQLYVDAMVDSGRAGDNRLGVHFFREWVAAITGHPATDIATAGGDDARGRKKKKKQKSTTSDASTAGIAIDSLPLGSLSLHNFAAASIQTFRSMEKANVGCCLGSVDLSGVHGLTDDILADVICAGAFPRLRRLSVKNCRRLTGKGVASLSNLTNLCAIDVGGCFNVQPDDVVSLVRDHPSTKAGTLTEIYAGGLGWTDVALEEVVDASSGHLRGLGVGFSPYISGPGLILTLSKVSRSLDRLAVPFCQGLDDAALSALGKNLTKLAVLDVRGCTKVNSLSGMMDGRAAATKAVGHLFVLARYSGVSAHSLEETMKLFDGLTCVLDGGGTGEAIRR